MLRAVRLKFLFLFILTIIAIVFVLPSFTTLPGWWEKHVSRGLKLGLDLKGGMHLILQVDMESAVNNALQRDANDMKEMSEKRSLALKVGTVSHRVLPVAPSVPARSSASVKSWTSIWTTSILERLSLRSKWCSLSATAASS